MSGDAPRLEEDDIVCWNWYVTNATVFVRDFGLMPSLIAGGPYEGVAKEVFMSKLSAIHDAVAERARKSAEAEAGKEKPEIVLSGGENG